LKTDETITVRDAALEMMRETGMTTLFGNPGSTELEFLHDWPSDLQYVLGLQESVVVAMADGFAQATGHAAIVNLHSAAGVGHALGSIYTAFRNQTPLVLTAGQQTRSLLPYRPFLGSTQATEFPRPYVKWTCEPARAEDVPLALQQAHAIAMQRPRGPVLVSIPSDDWHRQTTRVRSVPIAADGAADPACLAGMAERLMAASRVALVFGAGVGRDGARKEAVELAERLGADAFAAPIPSRSVFDETHSLYRGALPAEPGPLFKALTPYDAILVVGAPAFILHVAGDMPEGVDLAALMHITDDPDTAASSLADTVAIASPRAGLLELLAHIPAVQARTIENTAAIPQHNPAMTAEYVVARIGAYLPQRCAVVEEAPSHKEVIQGQRMFDLEREYFAMSSGGLGFALPAAVGIALSSRFPRVLCLVGDGSAMYTIQALYTAAQLQLPVTFLILNNQGYGAMRSFSQFMKGSGAPGIDLPGLDFVAIAQGHGVPARSVATADDIDPALEEALSTQGPALIDFRIDPGVTAIYGVEN
jgi:benzoylformate decarboxylase